MQYILIPIAITIVFSILWNSKIREEKKLLNEKTIRTRSPKAISGFFLTILILACLGGIATVIFAQPKNKSSLFILVGIFAIPSLIGYLYGRFTYLVVDDKGVMVYRLFGKNKYFSFEEICYLKDTTDKGMHGELICYNKEKKKIFSVEAIQIGVVHVIERLRENGVQTIYF